MEYFYAILFIILASILYIIVALLFSYRKYKEFQNKLKALANRISSRPPPPINNKVTLRVDTVGYDAIIEKSGIKEDPTTKANIEQYQDIIEEAKKS